MNGGDEERSGKTLGKALSRGEGFSHSHSEGMGETHSTQDGTSFTTSITTSRCFSEEDPPGADETRDIREAVTVSRARFAGGIVTFTINIDLNRLAGEELSQAGTSMDKSWSGKKSHSGESGD